MEKEMEKVRSALEDFSKKVVDVVKKGKGEADKVTRIAQIRIEIGSLTRQQKDLYQELGELFYKNLDKPGKKGEGDITESVSQLREVEKNITSLKRILKAVKEDKPAPRKRGRPPKAASADKAPKKRGRPPKPKTAGTAAPKKRGRPPKAASAKTAAAAPKRRGRPPKSAAKG